MTVSLSTSFEGAKTVNIGEQKTVGFAMNLRQRHLISEFI